MVWGVSVWSILLYIKLSIFSTLPIPVHLHPPNHPVFPLCFRPQWWVPWSFQYDSFIICFIFQVLQSRNSRCLRHYCGVIHLGIRNQFQDSWLKMVETASICDACCLSLGSFRLLTHVLGSRIYHWGAETGPICENTENFKNVQI